jgi:hypothetical protein
MAKNKAEKERARQQKEETLNKGIPLHRGPDDATRKAVTAGLENDAEPRHRKQRPLRRHAPKNAAAWNASPEEHPDDEKRAEMAPNEDGHNSETAEKVG